MCEPPYKLPDNARNHKLKGSFEGYMEFHLKPDLLVVYTVKDKDLIFLGIGSHSDLFELKTYQ